MLFFQGVNDSAAMQQQLFTVRLSNLQFVYAETATYYLSVAMWHGMLLSQWLYLLRPDTRTVGIAEGLPGLVKLAAAVAGTAPRLAR